MPIDLPTAALFVVGLVAALALAVWLAASTAARRSERALRELRDEMSGGARDTRHELRGSVGELQRTLLAQAGDTARTQNEQIDAFARQLAQTRGDLAESARLGRDSLDARFAEVRAVVEQRLGAIQGDNEKKLELIRATVDEKLHATLEQRLGESFARVAERLEQVHRGIGEMQKLASDVGSLSRVLSNVKSRGLFGEVQLGQLLDQVLTVEQVRTNVETVPGSNERVEFAVRMPGRVEAGPPVWLPIDCKFPREDYERLVHAQEEADRAGAEAAGKAIERRLREEARTIRQKYVSPPHTTDFGILFVPTEGLYAEALRRPGLVDALHREHRVMLTGPTTLLALLNSLQMGFRTLAIEKRSTEVWETLGAVKTEFGKFGAVLAKTKKKLGEATATIEEAEKRTRVMTRSLRDVEGLTESEAGSLLPDLAQRSLLAPVEDEDEETESR